MVGEVESIQRVGCIYQIEVMTQYGRFLFRENELESARLSHHCPSPPVSEAAPPKPPAIKIKYEHWFEETFGKSLRKYYPQYNNGQIAMKAKTLLAQHFKEALVDKTIEELYRESNTYKQSVE